MEAQLNEAVEGRITKENAFIEAIIEQINTVILTLDECDPSNARTAIDLTQDQLSDIILKLDRVTNMTDKTASIANILRDNKLMRRPNALPPPQGQSQTVQPPPPPQTQVQQTQPASQIQRPAPLPINPAQAQQPSRQLGTRTMLAPIKGGRRTRRKRKTRR